MAEGHLYRRKGSDDTRGGMADKFTGNAEVRMAPPVVVQDYSLRLGEHELGELALDLLSLCCIDLKP